MSIYVCLNYSALDIFCAAIEFYRENQIEL